eukprot:gene16017-13154_t
MSCDVCNGVGQYCLHCEDIERRGMAIFPPPHDAYNDAEKARRPTTPLENTFKMKPDRKFEVKPVRELIETVLNQQLEEEKYDARASRQMAKTLSTIITHRVKYLRYERYKIVTHVTIGEVAGQGVRVASRCLMDQDTDAFATWTFRSSSLFCVATVYGFYHE